MTPTTVCTGTITSRIGLLVILLGVFELLIACEHQRFTMRSQCACIAMQKELCTGNEQVIQTRAHTDIDPNTRGTRNKWYAYGTNVIHFKSPTTELKMKNGGSLGRREEWENAEI